MARQRRRRDQIWNPPSRAADISAIFVVFAAGPLLLPLIGAQIQVIAFAAPLLFCLFAAWRCALAARRDLRRAPVWITVAASVITAAAASVVALLSTDSRAPFYVGTAASVLLLVAMFIFAGQVLRGVPRARIADGLLFPVLAGSITIWFVAIPGFRDGDQILTIAVVLDLIALCMAAVALVVRPTGGNLQVTALLVLGLGLATAGDGLISSDAAGLLSTSGLPTALMWAAAAYLLALAADFDTGVPSADERDTEANIGATRWVIARVILPLVAVVIVPVILVALYAAGALELAAIIWFATAFLLVLGLAFGRQAFLLLDNRRSVILERELRQEVMRRNEELEALTGLATTMTQTLEEAPILERGLGVLHLAARANSSAFFMRAADGSHSLSATTGSWPTEHAWAGTPEAPQDGRALHTRGGRQILRLGLATRGHEIGFVTLMRDAGDGYEQSELDLLGLLGDQLAIAVQNARDYREKLEQAIRDPLTGLYNRRFFYEALEKEIQRTARYGTTASLVLFDVDDFKSINDSLGHGAGDDVLRRIGQIANGLIRPTDSFARLGGEEFALLLPETSQLEALLAAERLRTAIARHEILGGERRVTVSGGVACCPGDAVSLDELQRRADAALYWAKRNGKNLCAVSSEVNVDDREDTSDSKLAHLHALVTMIDAQHLQTRDHSENVAAYSVALGRALDLYPERVVRLRQAAHFHDIGKVAVSSEILNKPSLLSAAEAAEIRLHPAVGATMLMHAGLHEEARWIRCHHEWVDGGGYPNGLKGEQIPLESRIILVADAFEAMTSDRPYSDGIPVEDALRELRACAGSQFDPQVVDALVDLVERGELPMLALRNAPAEPR